MSGVHTESKPNFYINKSNTPVFNYEYVLNIPNNWKLIVQENELNKYVEYLNKYTTFNYIHFNYIDGFPVFNNDENFAGLLSPAIIRTSFIQNLKDLDKNRGIHIPEILYVKLN